MWTFITQLLVSLVLLGFFLVSCQNVMHIVKGSLSFVLRHIHQELDKELGESEGLNDDEETISTRVVRRRVLWKVTARQEAGLGLEWAYWRLGGQAARAESCALHGEELGKVLDSPGQDTRTKEKGQENIQDGFSTQLCCLVARAMAMRRPVLILLLSQTSSRNKPHSVCCQYKEGLSSI